MKKKSTEQCIRDFKMVHGDKYDYSKVNYENSQKNVLIICPLHGEFYQTPANHLNGKGCSICGRNRQIEKASKTVEEFEKEANNVHNGKYKYHQDYKKYDEKITITCQIHGDFKQTPINHLKGCGCQKCKCVKISQALRGNYKDFEYKANIIHKNKYVYHQDYVNNHTKVLITCPIHGDFYQTPNEHLCGSGCMKCGIESSRYLRAKSVEQFEEEANKVHNMEYDYFQDYKNAYEKVKIKCKKCGFIFLQNPSSHLQGHGCPKCNSSNMEKEISEILRDNGIQYIQEASSKVLKWAKLYRFDFYLPNFKTIIECQGIQHFEPIEFWNGMNGLIEQKERDKEKRKLCEDNNFKLLYYSNLKYDFPYEVITDKKDLINKIIN